MVRAIEKGVVRDLLNKLAKYLGEGTSRKAAKGNFRCFSFLQPYRSVASDPRAEQFALHGSLQWSSLMAANWKRLTPVVLCLVSRPSSEFQSRMAPPLSGDTICQQNRRKLSEIQRSFPEWDRSPVTAG